MAADLGEIIKQIIDIDSEDIFSNSKRFNALLDDLAPDLITERKVFHRAVSDEVLLIFGELRATLPGTEEFELLKIKKKLEDDYGLSESWSILIVSGFANAFGIKHALTVADPEDKHSEVSTSKSSERSHINQESTSEPKSSDTISSTDQRKNDLIKQKELLLQEKSSLGLFSLKRKAEIEKMLSSIDLELALEHSGEVLQRAATSSNVRETKNRTSFQLTEIKTFSADGSANGPRLWASEFLSAETRYVGVSVHFEAEQYDRIANLSWKIYNGNGTPFSSEIKTSITVTPDHLSVYHQWGFADAGKWPIGRYKIVASINGSTPIQTWFEVKSGRYDILPTPLKTVRLFNGGGSPPPVQQREYTNLFYKSSTRYIYFQLEFAQPGRNLNTIMSYIIRDEAGNVLVNAISPLTIQSNSYGYWKGLYGWETPGNWKVGRYSYSISLGKSAPITGTFEIKG